MIKSFPKILTIGDKYIKDIFEEEVEVTEKVDGSQFSFGKHKGVLCMRSKNQELSIEEEEGNMFSLAIKHIKSVENRIPDGYTFNCEFLSKRRHSTLNYGRVPRNNLVLFSVMDESLEFHDRKLFADSLDIESVPVLYFGKIEIEGLKDLITRESFLGGVDIEGVVVKNYKRECVIGGRIIPLTAGKIVTETFKEVHNTQRSKEEKQKDRVHNFFMSHKTEARWVKAVQHLEEKGGVDHSAKDIGKLAKEVNLDIEEEEKEKVKGFLWGEFKGKLFKQATSGMPEWYKKRLEDSLQ